MKKLFYFLFIILSLSLFSIGCNTENNDTEYSITILNSDGGSISSSHTKAKVGEEVSLTISLDANKELEQLVVKSRSTSITVNNNKFIMPASNVEVSASFRDIETEYDITISNANGGSASSLKHKANAGDNISLTITPETGKELDELLVKCGQTEIEVNNNEFTMPEGNVEVSVTFKNIIYSITFETYDGGSITLANALNEVIFGAQINLNINPNITKVLKAGSLSYFDGSNNVNIDGDTFTMPASNITIRAEFENLIAKVVDTIVTSSMKMPDPWVFLPDAFALENRVYSGPHTIDYTEFVSISNIPTIGMGKQMNVLYDIMIDIENILTVVTPVYGAAQGIADLYQTFVNNNPDNYSNFEGSYGGFQFKITLVEDQFDILIGFGSIAIELYSNGNGETLSYGGRIQLTDGNAIRYDITDNSFKVATRLLGVNRTQLEFVREDEKVAGYLYMYNGIGSIALTTRALLAVDDNYTTIIGESGDFITGATVKRNVEVYDSKTGKLVGTEVKEEVSLFKYDTLWYTLDDIQGINNIKVIAEANGINPNTIYINDKTTAFAVVGGTFLQPSRKYDIEIKTQYFYLYDEDSKEYSKISLDIPMFFIQKDYETNNGYSEVSSKNNINAVNKTTTQEKEAVANGYTVLLSVYDQIRENMTPEIVLEYIGEKHSFFGN